MVGSAIGGNYSTMLPSEASNSLILSHLGRRNCYVTIDRMRPFVLLLAAVLLLDASVSAIDALAEARRLYNEGQYDAAERAARDAARTPAYAEGARVVLGRIQLERYRRTAVPEHLTDAIDALRAVDVGPLDPRERVELTIGLGEALYLEDRFGAAA